MVVNQLVIMQMVQALSLEYSLDLIKAGYQDIASVKLGDGPITWLVIPSERHPIFTAPSSDIKCSLQPC